MTGQRVALYMRVSSDRQAERHTIEAQRDFLHRFCKLNGMDIAGEYADEAVHGPSSLSERPQGSLLVQDAKAGKFYRVIVYRLDRLARSLKQLLDAQALLEGLKISLQSATEPIDTASPVGRLVFQILGSLAEFERYAIIERGVTGKARVAKNGGWTGGPPPIGYAVVNGYLTPNERMIESAGITEAEIVREVYRRIAEGSTLVREAEHWTRLGLKGRNGGVWNFANLGKLVHNPIYRGKHTFHGRDGEVARDVPALVSAELWEKAIAQLRVNSTRREEKRFNLLRGKVRCALCGSTFVASAWAKRGQVYYRCQRALRKSPTRCRSVSLNAPLLEGYIWRECEQLLRQPGRISSCATDQLQELADADANRGAETQRLQSALVEQEQAKQRIIRLVRLGKITDDDADRELDSINAEIGRLHGQLSALDSSRSLAMEYARRLREAENLVIRLGTTLDLARDEGKRQVIEALLQGVDVRTIDGDDGRRIDLTFRWIAQEPQGLMDPEQTERWLNEPIDQEPPEPEPGILVSHLARALSTEGGRQGSRTPTTPASYTSSW